MLLVRIELHPNGDATRRREIGRLALANISDLAATSDYLVVRIDEHGNIDDGIVTGHERAEGFWALLARACLPDLSQDLPPGATGTVAALTDRILRTTQR